MAHPDECRSKIMERIMKDDDPHRRATHATKKEIERSAMQDELESLVHEQRNIKRNEKGHVK